MLNFSRLSRSTHRMSVLGHLELLRATGALPETISQEIRRIYDEAERAARIVRNLMVFAGSGRLQRRTASVNGIVQNLQASTLPAETLTLKTFMVDGRLVATNADTITSGKGTLANGARVEVKGQQKNGYVLAASIHVN